MVEMERTIGGDGSRGRLPSPTQRCGSGGRRRCCRRRPVGVRSTDAHVPCNDRLSVPSFAGRRRLFRAAVVFLALAPTPKPRAFVGPIVVEAVVDVACFAEQPPTPHGSVFGRRVTTVLPSFPAAKGTRGSETTAATVVAATSLFPRGCRPPRDVTPPALEEGETVTSAAAAVLDESLSLLARGVVRAGLSSLSLPPPSPLSPSHTPASLSAPGIVADDDDTDDAVVGVHPTAHVSEAGGIRSPLASSLDAESSSTPAVGPRSEEDAQPSEPPSHPSSSDAELSAGFPLSELTPRQRADRLRAAEIALSYRPTEYRPPKDIRSDRHVQTIGGALLRGGEGSADDAWLSAAALGCIGVVGRVAKALGRELPREWKEVERALSKGNKDGDDWEEDFGLEERQVDSAAPVRPENPFYSLRRRFATPDGNSFDVDYAYADTYNLDLESGTGVGSWSNPSKGLVVMTHGLESSSSSPLNIDAARAFLTRGYDVAAINFRGCGGSPAGSWRQYHLGFTDDLRQFLEGLRSREANFWNYAVVGGGVDVPVYLCGFSLGANVVLKLLGELGPEAERLNIRGAAVANCPLDVYANRNELARPGINSLVYAPNLLQSLKKKVKDRLEEEQKEGGRSTQESKRGLKNGSDDGNDDGHNDGVDRPTFPFDPSRVLSSSTIGDFDESFVAPIFGFAGREDYYNRTSSVRYLDSIAVPTVVINSLDDPFLDADTYPREREGTPVRLVYTERGGHLGFMFHREEGPGRGDMRRGAAVGSGTTGGGNGGASTWMPNELARFVDYVSESTKEVDGQQRLGKEEDLTARDSGRTRVVTTTA